MILIPQVSLGCLKINRMGDNLARIAVADWELVNLSSSPEKEKCEGAQ